MSILCVQKILFADRININSLFNNSKYCSFLQIKFLALSFASLLWSPARSKTKKRSHANFGLRGSCLFSMLFLHFSYSVYSLAGVSVKRPIYLIIGQDAVNASTHNQPTILQDFLPCFLLALCDYIKYAIENILRPNSVNFLLHNLKIQPLIICIPLALHWTVCGV